MFGRLRRRLDNARQMQKMRKEHPEEIRRLLEERAREQQVPVKPAPAKSGPWIIFFRCILYILTVLVVLITFIGGPQRNAPIFTILSFGLLLAVLYLIAGLAQPAVVFFRKHWPRGDVLELFSLIIGALLIMMAIFRP
ncbi:hypothetical protein [Paenibacillus sp. FSL R7-0337]|uniref:hypothetical protein n=1 Tax=unclassified Paenibacillus TaxID=185978 RepID=UPI00096E74D1|nr:hypothetical protein [Paenibacillus sp. FSL R7-0337]OMF93621.1 hypothetical protein BK147_18065 [Paenibacillus sp. FSL R7-0337]